MPTHAPVRSLLLPALLLSVGGCDGPTGPSNFGFLVQVRAVSAPTAPGGQTGPSPAPGVLDDVEIDQAVVVFGGLTLEGTSRTNTADWNLDETVVVPLRLSGEPTLAFAPATDGGEYEGLRVNVDKLDSSDPDEAALIEIFPRMEGLSVSVEGTTLQGGISEPFSFTTSVPAEHRLGFSQPRRFSSEGASRPVYTVLFHLDRWFETAGGLVLDPNDEGDHAAIEESILGSMEVVAGGGG